jgi:hypothetical protein
VGAEIDALGIVGEELGSGGGSMVAEIVVDDAEDRSQGSEAFADRPIAAKDHAVFFKGVGDRIEDEAVGIDFAGGGAVGSTGAFDHKLSNYNYNNNNYYSYDDSNYYCYYH